MRKNSHDRILKGGLKEQHLSTVPKSVLKQITQCLIKLVLYLEI